MNIGDIVIFNEEKFKIHWLYESGYCEIKNIENTRNELVHVSEIQQY
ncbi:hypothetical protein SAMN05444673_2811 [Bacillus sp. OV166]|nr:hypothetical protein [Bacillus sp. OV166]SMQ77483.1 hypothetical protein SAMN05444673_2811 [Bacillus sp. OV166]